MRSRNGRKLFSGKTAPRSLTRLVSRPAAAAFFTLLLALSPFFPPSSSAKPPGDEVFTYDIDFFIFPKIAKGTIRIRRISPTRYQAELVAETKGIVGFLTAYRKNHYISELEYLPKQNRFLTRRHTRTVTRGFDVERLFISLDDKPGVLRWEFHENGKLLNKGTQIIPKGVVYEDLLSAFFNFRIGAFGPMTPGRKLIVTTFPRFRTRPENEEELSGEEDQRPQEIEVRVADPETERKYRETYNRTKEKGILVFAKVPKEVFGQKTGEIRVWFDPNYLPLSATVEDAIFFGDVTGTLVSTGSPHKLKH